MMERKKFHLGTVLSITGDKLVAPGLISDIYAILNFMTGDKLFTHQLLRARAICRPYLLDKFPHPRAVDDSGVNETNWKTWLQEKVQEFGEYLEVEKLPNDAYSPKDPILEAVEMVGSDKVIVVSVNK